MISAHDQGAMTNRPLGLWNDLEHDAGVMMPDVVISTEDGSCNVLIKYGR